MLESSRHILARLHELRTRAELRILRDPQFRSLCQDYGAAVEAFEHWSRSSAPEASQRIADYRALVLEQIATKRDRLVA